MQKYELLLYYRSVLNVTRRGKIKVRPAEGCVPCVSCSHAAQLSWYYNIQFQIVGGLVSCPDKRITFRKDVLTAKEKLFQFYCFIYKNTQTLKTHGNETSTQILSALVYIMGRKMDSAVVSLRVVLINSIQLLWILRITSDGLEHFISITSPQRNLTLSSTYLVLSCSLQGVPEVQQC